MADKKISALTASTTPLAGTEVLPIVQAGATVKVAVSDLTAGRNVSVKQLSVTDFTAGSVVFTGAAGLCEQDNANLFWDNTNNRLGIGTKTPAAHVNIYNAGAGLGNVVSGVIANTDGSAGSQALKIGAYQTGTTLVAGAQIRASYNYGGNSGTSLSLDYSTPSGVITEGLRVETSGRVLAMAGGIGTELGDVFVGVNSSSTSKITHFGLVNTITSDCTSHVSTMNNNDTLTITGLARGFIEIAEANFNTTALIMVGSGATTIVAQSSVTRFSTIANNANTINVYVSGGNVIIQSKNAATFVVSSNIRKLN